MATMEQPQPVPLPLPAPFPQPYPAEPMPELWRSEAFAEDLFDD